MHIDFRVDDAVPAMLVLLFLELLYSSLRGNGWYRGNDTLSSLSAGLMSRLMTTKTLQVVPYVYLRSALESRGLAVDAFDHSSPLQWAVLLLLVDQGYYFFHRAAHEWSGGWATHVAHHSSENYNFSTALRQGGMENWIGWLFYLPLTIILPLEPYLVYRAINIVFQFFVHTRAVHRFPWPIEFVFNTPSHHRVHHARNEIYLDKNYAGMFVLWDRLYGTFQAELDEEPPIMGLVTPLQSFNPLVVQFHHLIYMISSAWTQGNLRYLYKGPGFSPNAEHTPIPKPQPGYAYDPETPYKKYAYLSFGVTLAFWALKLTPTAGLGVYLTLVWHVLALGSLLEGGQAGGLLPEFARIIVTAHYFAAG